ncbi:MAG: hypothetical protein ACLQU5_10280 [Isosphaeraceae bacterium]
MRSPKPTLGRLFPALVLPLCLGVLSMSLAPPASRADAPSDSLSEVLHSAAEEILKVVKDQAVSVGQITPTGLPDANGGPAIVELLKQELEQLRPGSVRRAGAFEIKGDFNLAPHPDPSEAGLGQKVVRLLFRIVDTATGEENNLRLTRFLRDNTTIARVLGVSGPLPLDPAKDQREQRRERNKAIQDNLQNPKTFIDQKNPSRISSTSDSPFQVEILAGPLGDGKARPTEPRTARIEEGLGFVDVKRGEVYEVRIYNRSREEVAVRLFIDSLDMFHFSDGRDPKDPTRPKFAYLILPPGTNESPSVQEIAGWHKSIKGKENFLAFLVTEYGKGAASSQGIPASGPIGVIQVQFSRCHPDLPGGRKRSAGNETGKGPPREVGQTEVTREVEPPIDVVSVRYTR